MNIQGWFHIRRERSHFGNL